MIKEAFTPAIWTGSLNKISSLDPLIIHGIKYDYLKKFDKVPDN